MTGWRNVLRLLDQMQAETQTPRPTGFSIIVGDTDAPGRRLVIVRATYGDSTQRSCGALTMTMDEAVLFAQMLREP